MDSVQVGTAVFCEGKFHQISTSSLWRNKKSHQVFLFCTVDTAENLAKEKTYQSGQQ